MEAERENVETKQLISNLASRLYSIIVLRWFTDDGFTREQFNAEADSRGVPRDMVAPLVDAMLRQKAIIEVNGKMIPGNGPRACAVLTEALESHDN